MFSNDSFKNYCLVGKMFGVFGGCLFAFILAELYFKMKFKHREEQFCDGKLAFWGKIT